MLSNSIQCGFESHPGHHSVGTTDRSSIAAAAYPAKTGLLSQVLFPAAEIKQT